MKTALIPVYLYIYLTIFLLFALVSRASSLDSWTTEEIDDAIDYIKETYHIPTVSENSSGELSKIEILRNHLENIPELGPEQQKFHIVYNIDNVTKLWNHPLTTIFYASGFVLRMVNSVLFGEIFHMKDGESRLSCIFGRIAFIFIFSTLMIIIFFAFNNHTIIEIINSLLFWFIMGISSSLGFGFGFHTFTLYLGPKIVETTLDSLSNNASNIFSITFNMLPSVIAWGAGTAFGEMPTFLLTKAHSKIVKSIDMNTVDIDSNDQNISNKDEEFFKIELNEESLFLNSNAESIDQYTKKLWHERVYPRLLGRILGFCATFFDMIIIAPISYIIHAVHKIISFIVQKIFGCIKASIILFFRFVESILPIDKRYTRAIEKFISQKFFGDHGLLAIKLKSFVKSYGSLAVLLMASFPNPLFDMIGITCANMGLSLSKFFFSTLIGKSLIKAPLQTFILASITSNSETLLQYVPIPFVKNMIHRKITRYSNRNSTDTDIINNINLNDDNVWIAPFVTCIRSSMIYLVPCCLLVLIIQWMAYKQLHVHLSSKASMRSKNKSSDMDIEDSIF